VGGPSPSVSATPTPDGASGDVRASGAARATPGVRARVGAALGVVLAVGYPVLVYFGLTHLRARALALVLLVGALAVAALRVRRASVRSVLGPPVAIGVLLALGAVLDDARLVLALPVLVNAVLLVTFGATLFGAAPVPMIERFARLQKEHLALEERRYCRSVTLVWCTFFVVNGAIAGGLALGAPVSWWAMWTGLLSYVAMGSLFGAEWLVRRTRFGGR